jgi:hypothetical protein
LSKDCRYWVELDSNDTIVGGSYESWMRTDFIWMLSEVPAFSGYFKNVSDVYMASVKSQGTVMSALSLSTLQ